MTQFEFGLTSDKRRAPLSQGGSAIEDGAGGGSKAHSFKVCEGTSPRVTLRVTLPS